MDDLNELGLTPLMVLVEPQRPRALFKARALLEASYRIDKA